MFRSILLLLSGNSFFSLMSFLRNLLVARLLGIEDYGIAATFSVSIAIVEMLSNLGLNQMIVQDRRGDDPHMQATLHGFQLLRAMAMSTVLFFLAHPLAAFLEIPEVAWAYQVIALVPLFRGLSHLDMDRIQRQMRFLPSILGQTIPGLTATLLVWPLFLMLGDFRIMLFAIIAQATLAVVASRLLAERRFHLAFDLTIIRHSFKFGWPILLNGALLFVILHGEKLVVGRELGMEALAVFAMGFTLSLTPLSVVARSLSQFFLPQLSSAKDDQTRFNRIALVSFQVHFLCAVSFAALLTFFGETLVHFLLGKSFAPLGPLMAWLGILNAFRLVKGASALAAFSLGRTENAFWANLPRVAALPIAWYILTVGGGLITVIWAALSAEALGLTISLALLRRQPTFRLRPLFYTCALNIAFLTTLGVAASLKLLPIVPGWVLVVIGFIASGLFVSTLFVGKELRVLIGSKLKKNNR